MVFTARSLVLLASLLTATNALNDWSRPCLAGTCSYDLPDADGQAASGSIRIWSDNKALITDITQAADWEIIGCSPDKLAQDIRIVCKSDDSEKCNHLFDGGAEGKIVRLPQNCGQNAFARIGRIWVSDDQSVPQDVARRLVRRAGAPAQVRGVTIDTDFGAVDASKGKINFALRGANFQGAKGDIDVGQSNAARRRDLMARFGFGDIVSGIKDAAGAVANTAQAAAGAVADAGSAVVDAGQAAVNTVANTASNVASNVVDFGEAAVDKVADTAKTVEKKVEDTATKVVDKAKDVEKTVEKKVTDTAKDVKDTAAKAVDKAKDVADKAVDKVVDTAKDVADKTKDVATKAVGAAKNATEAAVDKAKDVAGDVVDKAKDVAGDVVDAGKNVLDKAENITSNAVSAVKDAAGKVVNATEDLGEEILGKAEDGLDAVGDGAKKALDFTNKVVGDLNNVSIDESKTFPPLAINKKFNLVNQKVSCPGRSAGLTVDVNANAQVVVTVGIAAAGTIVPPNFEDFALTTTINGDISSSIDLKASVSGSLDSGKIQILSVGVPGFSLPGIITVGPAFKIDAQALATLDLNVDVNVGVSYKIENVQAIFPPRNGDKVGTFSIGDTPLKLSASPSVAARGEVQAHIIPALTLGIDAIGGKAKADAFVNLDASAHAVLTLNANAEASASINTTGGKRRAGPARIEGRQVQTTASAGFGGCFDVFAQLDVNAGVEGSLFGLFDATKNFNLFTKKFDLFKKCFGNQARALPGLLMERASYTALGSHKRMSKVSRSLRHLEVRALGCPKAGVADAKSVVDSANAAAGAQ